MKSAREPATGSCLLGSLNHDGSGVGHCEGKVVFVDGGLPGEEVRFRYLTRKRRFDTGVVEEILTPSAERVEARCSHFGVCGGCRLQHLAPAAQVRAKEAVVREAFAHIAKVECAHWVPPLAGPSYGYRRKARLGARVVAKKGGLLVGFRERRHSYITPLSLCHTLDPRLGTRLPALKTLLEGLSAPEAMPQIEFAAGDDAAVLVFRHLVDMTPADRAALAGFGDAHGFAVYTQSGGPETVAPLAGESAPLHYALPDFGLDLVFGPTDFVQVNAAMNRAMVAQAVDWLGDAGTGRVLDLFCGLGNFTLAIARRAQSVWGVEGAAALVAKGQTNAHRNGLDNVQFVAADLDVDPVAAWPADAVFDAALLDPPRTGALAAVKALGERGVARIVYVSCNPATLARDAQLLVHSYGYRVAQAGVLDMFPHTHHIEAMALFTRDG